MGTLLCLVACGDPAGNEAPDVPTAPPVEEPGCDARLTDYAGDCQALEAPPPGEGYQVRYGPDDYDNPEAVAPFLLAPGGEEVDCVYRVLDNDAPISFNRYTVSTRPGAHHIILYATPAGPTDGFRDRCELKRQGGRLLGVLQGGIDGGVFEMPPSDQIAPENEGLATPLDARQTIAYELHAVNPTEAPLLRESWTNFYPMAPEAVREVAEQISFNGGLGMRVPPGTRAVVTNSCPAPTGGSIRVLEFFAHMHAHAARFSAFKVTPDPVAGTESRTLIYESYDWSELDRREFNSVVQNPAPIFASGVPGAHSGILTLSPGDRLDYECEFDNTEEYDLIWGFGAFTEEMCNLFGSYAPSLGEAWACVGF